MKTQFINSSIKNALISILKGIYNDKDYPIDTHIHDEYELCLCTEGISTYSINETEYRLNGGDVIFVNRNIPHGSIIHKESPVIVLIFRNPEAYDNVDSMYAFSDMLNKNAVIFEKDSSAGTELRNCIETIFKEKKEKNPSYEMYIKAEMNKIFAILYRHSVLTNPVDFLISSKSERMIPVLNYVNDNLKNKISLEDVSRILNVDKAHFCRMFKKIFNTSFGDYLNFVRIHNAEKLLLSTELTINEITEKCGFSSMAYFGKVFKKYKNCTPTQYRRYKA